MKKPRFEGDMARFAEEVEKTLEAIIDRLPRTFKMDGFLHGGEPKVITHNLQTPHYIVSFYPQSAIWSNKTDNAVTLYSPVDIEFSLVVQEVK